MSMSEHENQSNREWDNLFPSTLEPGLPDDFSEEDVAFAQELSTLFSLQDEILPPYYAQTLLHAEDPRYTPVDTAFALKTNARVFRALKLRRRLFTRHQFGMSFIGETLREIVRRKSLVAWAAALMLIMMLTVAFTGPSFEQGVSILLHGSKNGVLLTKHFPNKVRHHPPILNNFNTHSTQMSLIAARRLLHFNIYWPQWVPANYTLDNINIYEDPNNTWADGPIVDLVYDLDATNIVQKGTGQIVIREFKPRAQVLQVVQDGNAYPIDPDPNGNPRAIYVDGQWLATGKLTLPVWGRGARSEVIYQQDDVVFWVAGDLRDGVNQKVLWKLSRSIRPMSFTHPSLMKGEMATILLPNNSDISSSPFTNDIISSVDGLGGQYYVTMSAYSAGKLNSPTPKLLPRGH